MVKHNNIIPNGHWHKNWQARVKTFFNQPAQKKARRMARAAKAAKVAPRPVDQLRPVVRCPTIRYNRKVRVGRGFSLDELKAAGISKKFASTVGICVDFRRRNKNVADMQTNVERLQAYKARLIVFPRGTKQKNGDAAPEVTATATQLTENLNALPAVDTTMEVGNVAEAKKAERAFVQARQAQGMYKSGRRRANANKVAKNEAAKKAAKKKKNK